MSEGPPRAWAVAALLALGCLTAGPARAAETSDDDIPHSFHGQLTVIGQQDTNFHSPYAGANSLDGAAEGATSVTGTLFLGLRPLKRTELYVNPEGLAGGGLSETHGVAGFPNGEIYRVDNPTPKFNLSRLFVQQTIALGTEEETLTDGPNQVAGRRPVERLTLVFGKFSLVDYFDLNAYAHDARTQFMNWTVVDNGTWDYAADTRGYTEGFYAELDEERWAARAAWVLMPSVANGPDYDEHLTQAYSINAEAELRASLGGRPGRARLSFFANRGLMRSYDDMTAFLVQTGGLQPDVDTTVYRWKLGVGLNLEQELSEDLGAFLRLGWDDGRNESFVFTEVDNTVLAGLSLKGRRWARPADTVGLAFVVNGLSRAHEQFLAAGGYGFLLGDGQLNYGPEEILETYYSWELTRGLAVSGDVQYVINPGYNRDRGPAPIFAARLHVEL